MAYTLIASSKESEEDKSGDKSAEEKFFFFALGAETSSDTETSSYTLG